MKNYYKMLFVSITLFVLSACGGGGGSGGGGGDGDNHSPTLNAGLDLTVTEGSNVTLNCVGADSDGTIAGYRWLSGTTEIATTASYVIESIAEGVHTYTCEVKDNDDAVSSDDVTITATAEGSSGENLLQNISAGIDRKVQQNITITMVGRYEGNVSRVKAYLWKENDTVLSRSVSFAYTPTTVGMHTLTFGMMDINDNLYSDSVEVNVTQNIQTAQGDDILKASTSLVTYAKLNEAVTVTGSYRGGSGTLSYVWKEGGTTLSNALSFPYTPTSLGEHLLQLTIADGNGASSSEKLVVFTIGGATGKLVTLDSNGGEDNEIQINAALQEVADAGGGTVHLNAGTFVIGDPVRFVGDNTILEGDGSDNTIIKLKNNADWGVHKEDKYEEADPIVLNTKDALHNLAIRNLQVYGNKENQKFWVDSNDDGIKDDSEYHLVEDGVGNYNGIDFASRDGSENVSNILISNVFMNRNNSDAFIVNGSNIVVEKSKVRDIGHSAVYFFDPQNLLVEKNDFLITANSAVRWYDGNHIIIRDNLLEGESTKTGNSNFAIEVTSGQTPDVLDDVLIEHNLMRFTAGAAVALDAKTPATSKDIIIRNNIIYQCGNLGTWVNQRETGAIMLKNFTNTLIENNTIVNTLGSAIRLGGNIGFNDAWPEVRGLTATIRNNIITSSVNDNSLPQKVDVYGIDIAKGNSAECSYNNVWANETGNYHGCEPGVGSVSEDPKFKSIVLGYTFSKTNDINADLHLKSAIGRYDSHSKTWITDDESSVSINAGDPSTHYSGELSPNGNRVNMGAYGNTPDASKGTKSPPIAGAGRDQYIRVDNKYYVYVDLNAKDSYDDGEIKEFAWSKDGFSLADGVRPAPVPMGIGVHKVMLTITDDDGLSTSDTVLIAVRPNEENEAPIANAGEDQRVTATDENGCRVVLKANESKDNDGVVVDYVWSDEDGNVLAEIPSPTVLLAEGGHTITLTVTDNEGLKSRNTTEVLVVAKGNYALHFNSGATNDEYVYIKDIKMPEGNLTIEMWVKQDSSNNDDDALVSLGGKDNQRLTISHNGLAWGVDNHASEDTFGMNSWHHVAYVVNNKMLEAIYLDGEEQALVQNAPIVMPSSVLYIAGYYQNTPDNRNFHGSIDELRIWNEARTMTQIVDNKDHELIGKEEHLVGYWNFNDGSGLKLIDKVGGRDGDLFNMEAENWVQGALAP